MKMLLANGQTMIVSDPSKTCPNRKPFPHSTVIFGYVNQGTGPTYARVGVVWTLKDGNQYLYQYGPLILNPATILQPVIDGCNTDGCFFNCKVRPTLVSKALD